jgi:hypothetical protein
MPSANNGTALSSAFIGPTARGECLACEAVVSRADGRRRAAFNCALGCVKRQTSPIEPDEIGSLHHDDPLLTTASQARHAPRLAPYVDAHGRPRDGSHPSIGGRRCLTFVNFCKRSSVVVRFPRHSLALLSTTLIAHHNIQLSKASFCWQ